MSLDSRSKEGTSTVWGASRVIDQQPSVWSDGSFFGRSWTVAHSIPDQRSACVGERTCYMVPYLAVVLSLQHHRLAPRLAMTTHRGRGTPSPVDDSFSRHRTALILGGWSPGPFLYLEPFLQDELGFRLLHPSIEMPPVTCGWCCTWQALVLLAAYVGFIWLVRHISLIAREGYGAWASLGSVLLISVGTLLWIRLAASYAIQSAIQFNVNLCQRALLDHDIDLIIGFSWGGAVAAELLTEHPHEPFHGRQQPTVVLVAPTTSLVASVNAFQPIDAALRLRTSLDMPVLVVHAEEDSLFCPNAQRWNDKAGVRLTILRDNHVFLRSSSECRLKELLSVVLPRGRQVNNQSVRDL